MTRGIGWTRLLLALVVGASMLATTTGPAQAAPTACVARYSNPGVVDIPTAPPDWFTVGWLDIDVPDTRTVVDVDFGYDVSYPGDSSKLRFLLTPPQAKDGLEPNTVANQSSGPLSGTYDLDDEAATTYATASPPAGRYRPTTPAANVEGQPAAGRWRLWINNTSNVDSGSARNFTLTLTFATCDSDGDGTPDSADNCQNTPNDQANLDSDSLGDACDLDIDGDALANTVDGCPSAAAATTSGCQVVGRTASLRYAKATKKLKAVVRSDAAGCRAGASVALFRVKRGKDTKLVVGTTNANGRWTRKAPKVGGRYYVKVASSYAVGQAECGRARSTKARLP